LKTCLANLVVGDAAADHLVTEANHRRYAEKIGVPYVVVHGRSVPDPPRNFPLIYRDAPLFNPLFFKFQITELFQEFDRILFLDLDTVVTRSCPNILDFVPETRCGFVDEFAYIRPSSKKYHHDLTTKSGQWPLMWFYINSGVFVLPKCHADKYQYNPALDHQGAFDQDMLGLACQKDPDSYVLLDVRFNHTYMMRDFFWRDIASAWIVHTAGFTINKSVAQRRSLLQTLVRDFGL